MIHEGYCYRNKRMNKRKRDEAKTDWPSDLTKKKRKMQAAINFMEVIINPQFLDYF
jgi:hypothetical protein